jgi:type IV secretory pathway protease TraF
VLQHDRTGRPLQPYRGCRLLREDEVFLLNVRAPSSLDGRYFGPLNRAQIVGRVTPLWVRGGR